MRREFWAQFDLYAQLNRNEWQNKNILDGLVAKNEVGLPDGWSFLNEFSRIQILAAVLASNKQARWRDKNNRPRAVKVKDYARTGALQYGEKSGLLYLYNENIFQYFLDNSLKETGDVLAHPSLPDLSLFPPGSWAVQVHLTLKKPYISKDDVDFYILDNPVKKEWVFKVPYVAPSQWKGALRSAMMRKLVDALRSSQIDEEGFTRERLRLYRLFGNEKDGTAEFLNRALTNHRASTRSGDAPQAQEWEELYKQVALEFEENVRAAGYRTENVEGFQGRLHFYPTFFDRIDLEVINPHDRKTGAGKNPIYFECVPAGTEGVFTLLYVPLDQVGRSSREEIEQEAKADLKAVAEGVKAMLTEYGFGAKTSSGYGVVEGEEATVVVKTNAPGWFKAAPPSSETTEVVPPDEAFLKYLDETGEVKEAFKGSSEGGLLSNSEYKERGQSLGGGTLAEFRRFRAWYLKYGATWRTPHSKQKPADSSILGTPQKTFHSLSEFAQIAHSLTSGGGENA